MNTPSPVRHAKGYVVSEELALCGIDLVVNVNSDAFEFDQMMLLNLRGKGSAK